MTGRFQHGFIAGAPEEDAGMVPILPNHFTRQTLAIGRDGFLFIARTGPELSRVAVFRPNNNAASSAMSYSRRYGIMREPHHICAQVRHQLPFAS